MDMNKHISNNMPVVKISLEIFVGLCLYCGLSSPSAFEQVLGDVSVSPIHRADIVLQFLKAVFFELFLEREPNLRLHAVLS